MLETIIGLSSNTAIGIIGILAMIVSLFTEILKKTIFKKFPTKALALINSLIVTMGFLVIFCTINLQTVVIGIVGSFIVAFISMYGWDTFNELIQRFKKP